MMASAAPTMSAKSFAGLCDIDRLEMPFDLAAQMLVLDRSLGDEIDRSAANLLETFLEPEKIVERADACFGLERNEEIYVARAFIKGTRSGRAEDRKPLDPEKGAGLS
jgi:hypothetical protein